MKTLVFVFLLTVFCSYLHDANAAPHPILNFLFGANGDKKEEQIIEQEFGGPPCTVPEIFDQQIECLANLENHCNNIYEDYCITEQIGEDCKEELRRDCKKTYTTECITEFIKECKEEEYIDTIKVCDEKLEQECESSTSGLECKDVPSKECKDKPVQRKRKRCQENPQQQCKSTPQENCTDQTERVCRPVSQLDCTKILKREDCREIPSLICKPKVLVAVDIPCTGKEQKKFHKKGKF